jgi:hypothetical protein
MTAPFLYDFCTMLMIFRGKRETPRQKKNFYPEISPFCEPALNTLIFSKQKKKTS